MRSSGRAGLQSTEASSSVFSFRFSDLIPMEVKALKRDRWLLAGPGDQVLGIGRRPFQDSAWCFYIVLSGSSSDRHLVEVKGGGVVGAARLKMPLRFLLPLSCLQVSCSTTVFGGRVNRCSHNSLLTYSFGDHRLR